MKKLLLLLMSAMLIGSIANAAIVPCSSISNVDVTTLNGATNGCTQSGITFSNFQWANVSLGAPGPVILVSVTQTGSEIDLNFNPNMGANQDIHLLFLVTGGINGMDLRNNTGPSTIDEINYGGANCVVDINGTPTNCTLLVNTGAISGPGGFFPGPSSTNEFFYTQATGGHVWVFKDIATQGTGGNNSAFTESFVIPEPMTLGLMGSALIGLGLLRLRRKKN